LSPDADAIMSFLLHGVLQTASLAQQASGMALNLQDGGVDF